MYHLIKGTCPWCDNEIKTEFNPYQGHEGQYITECPTCYGYIVINDKDNTFRKNSGDTFTTINDTIRELNESYAKLFYKKNALSWQVSNLLKLNKKLENKLNEIISYVSLYKCPQSDIMKGTTKCKLSNAEITSRNYYTRRDAHKKCIQCYKEFYEI